MKEEKEYPIPTPKMASEQTLIGKYAESAMNGLLSGMFYVTKDERDILIKESFEIADRMIEQEFKK